MQLSLKLGVGYVYNKETGIKDGGDELSDDILHFTHAELLYNLHLR